MQRTVVLLKPDALQRGLVGEIVSLFEHKGLKIVALKMMNASEAILEEHYAHHKDKPFFKSLKEFMMSAPLVCLLLEGVDSVSVVRKMVGATNGRNADLGSIRAIYSMSTSTNVIHCSESEDAAKEEEVRFFNQDEILDWDRKIASFVNSDDEIK